MNFKYFNKVLLLLFLGALIFANKQAFCMGYWEEPESNVVTTSTKTDTSTTETDMGALEPLYRNGKLEIFLPHADMVKITEIDAKYGPDKAIGEIYKYISNLPFEIFRSGYMAAYFFNEKCKKEHEFRENRRKEFIEQKSIESSQKNQFRVNQNYGNKSFFQALVDGDI